MSGAPNRLCLFTLAGCEQDHQPFGVEPPRSEYKRVGRRNVQPLSIIDEAQHGLLLGGDRENGQDTG